MSLQHKMAVVTGGSRAIGRAQQTAASFTGQLVERADFGVTWGAGVPPITSPAPQ